MFREENGRLIREYDHERVWIEPWGEHALRVRASYSEITDDDWALLPAPAIKCEVTIDKGKATIVNGNIKAEITDKGQIFYYNQHGKLLLNETEDTYQLKYGGRELRAIPGGSDYSVKLRLEADPSEKLYGMGQYQHQFLNLKGCSLELTHRNSQISVPFVLSSAGYGFLWHNPAIGQAHFSLNVTEWTAPSAKQLDYWITAGDTPAEIEEAYAKATGTVPMMPDYGMGFWQCKLRYRTQEELLEVAREYKRRNLPIDVIVVDFFHWTNQGDWRFDPDYWPDPEGMVQELQELGIELMVSVWPTVQTESENYQEMLEKGYLLRSDRGVRTQFQFLGQNSIFDATNPEARQFLWGLIKQNYYDKGIRVFWLDEAEPELTVYDHDIYRYHIGSSKQIGNIYPVKFSQTFYDGMSAEGQSGIINLVRSAWAGSQRYGALVWSGDIHSSFKVLGIQVRAGLNMAMAGIPWWTTDIGGFHGGNLEDSSFRELMVRWFQYGAFSPVFRLHGDRQPFVPPTGTKGGGVCGSGSDNEVWSYGEEAYDIFKEFLQVRERLKPYISGLMRAAHEKGTPPMRPLFYDFPQDPEAWEVEDQYMFGPDLLVAPVLFEGVRERKVYLPAGSHWTHAYTREKFAGGQVILSDAPLHQIPLFLRDDAALPVLGEPGK
ncbi:family 31 glucosidase [Paenibacillus sp. P3E]|uniref:glycoside hydrolase family 31 protein n=1 Tax=Paenibacillus sp. P3E TaxID=1349435 RepID=UPI00093F9CAF|nr:glycoside hydrolase family 31 protein [Paenibacillus sp. P3E]OKP76164.1 family 31 glucosidase [Paenibacillus sp. P3E]